MTPKPRVFDIGLRTQDPGVLKTEQGPRKRWGDPEGWKTTRMPRICPYGYPRTCAGGGKSEGTARAEPLRQASRKPQPRHGRGGAGMRTDLMSNGTCDHTISTVASEQEEIPAHLGFTDLANIHHPLRWRHGGAELACVSVPSSGGLLRGFVALCGHERWHHPRLPGRTAWQIRATLEVE